MLGTGTILIPWAVLLVLQGQWVRAVGMTGIYLAAMLIRSAMEPKLVGRHLGLNPLVTLAALYAGYRLWAHHGDDPVADPCRHRQPACVGGKGRLELLMESAIILPKGSERMELKHVAQTQARLSAILRQEMNVSSGLMNRLKWEDRILVNGVPQRTNYGVQQGDVVSLLLDEPEPEYPAEDLPLTILYEDEHILAVDKPAGMLIHPSRNRDTGTLANGVAGYYRRTGQKCAFHPVTRLDRDTFGVVLIAKNSHIHGLLNEYHARGELHKTYHAWVLGCPEPGQGRVDAPILRCPLPQPASIHRPGRQAQRHRIPGVGADGRYGAGGTEASDGQDPSASPALHPSGLSHFRRSSVWHGSVKAGIPRNGIGIPALVRQASGVSPPHHRGTHGDRICHECGKISIFCI